MKRNILTFLIAIMVFGLFGFGIQKWKANNGNTSLVVDLSDEEASPSPFLMKIEPRFHTRISKEKIALAEKISDLVPENATTGMYSFRDVKVYFDADGEKKIEIGKNEILNENQKNLLSSIDYSEDFHVEASCVYDNPKTGAMEVYDFVYYISVVPEKEAEYAPGADALIQYLRDNSQNEIDRMSGNQLQPGRIEFTVTSDGNIKDVTLNSTSGYMHIDVAFLELIPKTSGKWEPALNAKGEKIEQRLTFFFGMEGC
jgi:hypothetical protein